jgi:O-antigen/teichoic acid export membrane protein
VVRGSAYLFSGTGISAALGMLQGILVTRLIGVEGLGVVTAVVTFASNIHRLFSFRMSEVVVRYLNEALSAGGEAANSVDKVGSVNSAQAAAVVKLTAILEGAASAVAYVLLFILAPLAAVLFTKDAQNPTGVPAAWFSIYGLVLLANLFYETSSGVLQVNRRFDRLAAINLAQSLVTVSIIGWAFFTHQGRWEVLAAYLVGKAAAGILMTITAWRQLNQTLGPRWLSTPLSQVKNRRDVLRFALNTNLHGTVSLVVRDSEPLIINALLSPLQGGYYNIAYRLINLITIPIDPLIAPTYTELSRAIAQGAWASVRQLLRRVSGLAGLWVGLAGGGVALVGWWLIPFLYTTDAAPAYPAYLILLAGYGTAGVFQWNRSLLLSLGKAEIPFRITAIVGLVKTALTFLITPVLGYLAEAALLSGYFVVSIGWLVRRGLGEMDSRQTAQDGRRTIGNSIRIHERQEEEER